MYKATVHFETVVEAKAFVTASNEVDFKVELVSGPYIIDAKSIMGLFSLDLSKPHRAAGLLQGRRHLRRVQGKNQGIPPRRIKPAAGSRRRRFFAHKRDKRRFFRICCTEQAGTREGDSRIWQKGRRNT